MTGEALRNLNDTSDSICCLLGPHVSLPRCLRLWHRPLPLCLFLGGVQPGGLCLPGSKELHPPHDSLAVAIKGKTRLKPIICVTLWLFFSDLNYGFPGAGDKYFARWKNTQWRRLALSHAIYTSQRRIWPSVNFDTPQCFSWQSPYAFSGLWKLNHGCCLRAAPLQSPGGPPQTILWNSSDCFHLPDKPHFTTV